MAPRVLEQDKDEFFAQRYRQIRHYEQYLYEQQLPRGEDLPACVQKRAEKALFGAHR